MHKTKHEIYLNLKERPSYHLRDELSGGGVEWGGGVCVSGVSNLLR